MRRRRKIKFFVQRLAEASKMPGCGIGPTQSQVSTNDQFRRHLVVGIDRYEVLRDRQRSGTVAARKGIMNEKTSEFGARRDDPPFQFRITCKTFEAAIVARTKSVERLLYCAQSIGIDSFRRSMASARQCFEQMHVDANLGSEPVAVLVRIYYAPRSELRPDTVHVQFQESRGWFEIAVGP